MPVFGTMAARFNDDGVTALFQAIAPALVAKGLKLKQAKLPVVSVKASSRGRAIVPAERARYLAEIAGAWLPQAHCRAGPHRPRAPGPAHLQKLFEGCNKDAGAFAELIDWKDGELTGTAKKLLDMWPKTVELYAADEYVVKIRDKEIRTKLTSESLSGSKIRKVPCPPTRTKARPCVPDEGKRPRLLPLHRRRVRLQARR
jgi:methylmalonyl-CoA mutase